MDSIDLIVRKKQNLRIMVVIYSREVDSSLLGVALEGNRNVENQLESMLLESGFQLVDADQGRHKRQLETSLLKGDPSEARRTASKAFFREGASNRGQIHAVFSTEIRLKALETDTAKVLYSGYRARPP